MTMTCSPRSDRDNRIVHFAIEDDGAATIIVALLEGLGYTPIRDARDARLPSLLEWSFLQLAARFKLTAREVEVGGAVLRGDEPDRTLGITAATCKWHLHNIFAKTGVDDRLALLRKVVGASRLGLPSFVDLALPLASVDATGKLRDEPAGLDVVLPTTMELEVMFDPALGTEGPPLRFGLRADHDRGWHRADLRLAVARMTDEVHGEDFAPTLLGLALDEVATRDRSRPVYAVLFDAIAEVVREKPDDNDSN